MSLLDRMLHRDGSRAPQHGGGWSPRAGAQAFAQAERIVRDYAAALASKQRAHSGCIADERELPHSKERIKHAIALLLGVSDDLPFREQLKTSYLLLADWQEGVGEQRVGVFAATPSEGAAGGGDRDENDAAWQAWEQWRPRVLQEERALKAELQQLGLW
jgi:hypothetical protein